MLAWNVRRMSYLRECRVLLLRAILPLQSVFATLTLGASEFYQNSMTLDAIATIKIHPTPSWDKAQKLQIGIKLPAAFFLSRRWTQETIYRQKATKVSRKKQGLVGLCFRVPSISTNICPDRRKGAWRILSLGRGLLILLNETRRAMPTVMHGSAPSFVPPSRSSTPTMTTCWIYLRRAAGTTGVPLATEEHQAHEGGPIVKKNHQHMKNCAYTKLCYRVTFHSLWVIPVNVTTLKSIEYHLFIWTKQAFKYY